MAAPHRWCDAGKHVGFLGRSSYENRISTGVTFPTFGGTFPTFGGTFPTFGGTFPTFGGTFLVGFISQGAEMIA